MTNLFQSNLLALYFLYGLSFYTMGLAIAVQYRSYSTFRLAYSLSLLAAFGVLHGLSEWGSIFVPFQVPDLGQESVWKLIALQRLMQAVAYFFLFIFGVKLATDTLGRGSWLIIVPVVAFLIWLSNYVRFVPLVGFPDLVNWMQLSEVWSRYLLALPGGLITGYALALQTPDLELIGKGSMIGNLRAASGAFIFFAIFSGLVGTNAPFFPASIINASFVYQWTGLPVELFRTVVGFVVAYSITRILAVFDLEKQRRLDESHRQQAVLVERERFSRDLHDGVLQSIYGVGISLQTCLHLVQQDPEGTTRHINSSMQRLNDAIQNIRSYINGLVPVVPGESLEHLLHSLLDEFRQDYNIQIDFYYDESVQISPEEQPLLLHDILTIIREALHNVGRHAHASAVRVSLCNEGKLIGLSIRDNGVGFAVDVPNANTGQTRHHGLQNIKARALERGGDLEIKSVKGEGTELHVSFPYNILTEEKSMSELLGTIAQSSGDIRAL